MPQDYTFTMAPASTMRWVVARALIVMFAGAIRLSLKLLAREHPTRIFLEGRLAESIPAAERSLCRGPLRSYLGEAAVGVSALIGAWIIADFFIDLVFGPFELLALLP